MRLIEFERGVWINPDHIFSIEQSDTVGEDGLGWFHIHVTDRRRPLAYHGVQEDLLYLILEASVVSNERIRKRTRSE